MRMRPLGDDDCVGGAAAEHVPCSPKPGAPMTTLRVAGAAILGWLVVALGQTLIVWTWWIRELFPLNPLTIVAIAFALLVLGWIAGFLARKASGGRKSAGYVVAALTLLVLVGNVVLDVAVEPSWFKGLVLVLLIPMILLGGHGGLPKRG